MGPLPPGGLRFGVATAGFQVEGGYNGPRQPANNWAGWERAGRVEKSGLALDAWRRWPELLDRVVATGSDSFRLSVEWARCEPADGDVDGDALAGYAALLDGCHQRGLEPLVTLHHFTHPAWLGEDFWLRPDAPERYRAWVEVAISALGQHCRRWITVNEPNALALWSFYTGRFPPGRHMDLAAVVTAFDHLLTAHLLAYEAIKAAHPDHSVSLNPMQVPAYELDRLLVDVLVGRSSGVVRDELHPWLVERRNEWYHRLGHVGPVASFLRRRTAASVPLEQALPRAVTAAYASGHERCLDSMTTSRQGRPWPSTGDTGPSTFGRRLRAEAGSDLVVEIVADGLGDRHRHGPHAHRQCGYDRTRYLAEAIGTVMAARDAGVPVGAYFHWSLVDAYEWGGYGPGFGTEAYWRIIHALRAGDRSLVIPPGRHGPVSR